MTSVSVLGILVLLLSVQLSSACCSYYGCYCVYTLWYFWFGLFWVIVFFAILIVGCIKKKNREANRISNVPVVSCNNVPLAQNCPVPPPSYGQPSYQPPPYLAPSEGMKTPGQAMYPPPGGNVYPPPGGTVYPPPPPPANTYPPAYAPISGPAYPPNP